jgi:chemosensory pili system protein ChpC
MGETRTIVRSLLISVGSQQLLVPTAVVAEIVSLTAPIPVENSPSWLLGRIAWRGLLVPLVSFQAMQGKGIEPVRPGRRVAIFNTLRDDPALPFYALLVRGIPHMVQAGTESVIALDDGGVAPVLAEQRVRVGDDEALIPDLDGIENLLVDAHAELSAAANETAA